MEADTVIDDVLYVAEGMPRVESHKNETDFTGVVIPSSVEVITNSAFYGTKIEDAELPSSVKIIKTLAFHSCEDLKSVTLPNSVKEIGDAAFQNCTSLTSVVIPNSIREISYKLFKGSGLTEITIPGTVKVVGKEAFADCKVLKTVVIEDGVRKIDNNAFYNTGIDTIVVPESVTILGKNITSKGVVWVVEKDSYAHTYAIENNITFKIENSEGNDTETYVIEQFTNINIYTQGRTIVVENATDEIRVYDVMGRLVCMGGGRDVARNVSTININDSGVYIVKIGGVAKKVFVW